MQLTVDEQCSLAVRYLAFAFQLYVTDVIFSPLEIPLPGKRETDLDLFSRYDLRRQVPAGEREVVLPVHVDLVVAGDQQQRGYGHSGRKCEIDHLVHKLYI